MQTTVWTSAVATRFETSRGLAFAVTLSGGSLAAARTFVEVLDREALARGRAITKAMAGDVLRLLDENVEL